MSYSESNQGTPGLPDDNISNELIAATTIVLLTSTPLLILRLYARNHTRASRGWDDFLLPPAWFFLLGLGITNYVSITYAGVGRHISYDRHAWSKLVTIFYIVQLFCIPCNMFSRVSVVALYLRILKGKAARTFCWVALLFLIGIFVSCFISVQLQCIPLASLWDESITDANCFNHNLWFQATGLLNVIADIAIMVLPMHTVWTIKTSTSRKLGIALVCLTGSVGLVASCVRTSLFFDNSVALTFDMAYYSTPRLVWTVVESGMYLNAACLVGLRPLMGKSMEWIREHNCLIDNLKQSNGSWSFLLKNTNSADPSTKQTYYANPNDITFGWKQDHSRYGSRDGDMSQTGLPSQLPKVLVRMPSGTSYV